MLQSTETIISRLVKLLQEQKEPPTQKVHEGSVVAFMRMQQAEQLTDAALAARQAVMLVAQPDLSMCGRVAASLAQALELQLRLYSLQVQASMWQLSEGAGQAAAAAGTGEVPGLAAGRGQGGGRGHGCGRGRGGAGRASQASMSPGAVENKVKQLLQAFTSTYLSVVNLLGQEVAVSKAASCFRAMVQMQLAHMQLALQCVMHLQSLKPARMQQLLVGVQEQELALVLGLTHADIGLAADPLGLIHSEQTDSSSSSVSPWHVTVTGAAEALRHGTAHWSKFVLTMQQELLVGIDHFGRAALALVNEHRAGCVTDAPTVPSNAAQALGTSAAAAAAR